MIERGLLAAAAAVIATGLLAGCAANELGDTPSDLRGTLDGSGSSAQGAAQEVWVAGFQRSNAFVTVNYDPAGSGAGREAFLSGGTDYAGSDSPLSDEELAGDFLGCAPGSSGIDLPLYISPIAIAFNIEGVDELNLDAAAIANIFAGEITRWDDPALVELNPEASLPAATITAVHRSDDSGTTKNFTDYLFQAAPEAWAEEPSDTFPFASGEAAQGNSGVVSAVRNGVNTIGYADASKVDGLTVASLRVGDEFVPPSPEAAAAIAEVSPRIPGRAEHDLALQVDRTSQAEGVYPLVLISYVIACEEYPDANTALLVTEFLRYVVSDAGQQAAAESAGSAPLADGLREEVLDAIDSIR